MISKICLLSRCLLTESLIVFFDTITPYPLVFLEKTTVKFGEDTRPPVFKTVSNWLRGSRSLCENTVFKRLYELGRHGDVPERFSAQKSFLCELKSRELPLASSFWVDRFFLWP